MDDSDIYRTARQMIEQHGDKAVERATMNLDLMKKKNDMDGLAVWLRVIQAIKGMENDKPERVVH